MLLPLVSDPDTPLELAGVAALSLGLVFTSSAKDDVVMALLQVCDVLITGERWHAHTQH
jgi:hypothetical protein